MAAAGSVQGITNSFRASTPVANTSIIHRINGLFGSSVVYFAAGAAYCLYQVYKAYQYSLHTSYGLDDKLKVIKCKALLLEVAEKKATGDVQPLLKECESLLNSISSRSHSSVKETLLAKLAQYYVGTDQNPAFSGVKETLLAQLAQHHVETDLEEHAFSIAKQLTHSSHLYDTAQSLQTKGFDSDQVNTLYQKAKQAIIVKKELFLSDVNWLLKLANAFDSVGNTADKDTCLNEARTIASSLEPFDRITAYCDIAKCSSQIADQSFVEAAIAQAQAQMGNVEVKNEVFARFLLADTFLFLGDGAKMDQELDLVVKLIELRPCTLYKGSYKLINFIKKIDNNTTIATSYKNRVFPKPLINPNLSPADLAQAHLSAAKFYQEGPEAETSRNSAYASIKALPEDTRAEINSKIDLLIELTLLNINDLPVAQEILQALEKLYDKCPTEVDPSCPISENWNKSSLGQSIIMLYNQMKLTAASEPFFKRYLLDFVNQRNPDTSTKIKILARSLGASPEQAKAKLEAAEKLLPQLSSYIERGRAQDAITEGYLNIDRQKSLEILKAMEDRRAYTCLFNAGVTAVALGAIHFFPAYGTLALVGIYGIQAISISSN